MPFDLGALSGLTGLGQGSNGGLTIGEDLMVMPSATGSGSIAGMGMPFSGMGGGPGGFLGTGMSTMQGIGAALGGLQTLAGIWNSFQANKLAKKSFKFNRDMSRTNLANQVQSYNTALADRSRSRGAMEGQSQAQMDAYVSNNSLSTRPRQIG